MSAERHIVTIATELTGRVDLTPEQFDLLLSAALIGLEDCPEPGAEALYEIVAGMERRFACKDDAA